MPDVATLAIHYCPAAFVPDDEQRFHHNLRKAEHLARRWQAFTGVRLVEATPVDRSAALLAHDAGYVDQLFAGQRDNAYGTRDPAVLAADLASAGCLLAAAREAMAGRRLVFALAHLGHHAHHSLERGYCTLHGGIIAGELLRREQPAARIGILDFDFHYGDGTDHIIRTLKLEHYVHYSAGAEYVRREQASEFLQRVPALVAAMAGCNVVLYQSGADVHVDDQVGGWLTSEQFAERERLVFASAARHQLPLVWCYGGGYQRDRERRPLIDNIVEIHTSSLRKALRLLDPAVPAV